ncbi:hypothetical protein RND71_007093 [Anisodus tanguticus]|uniref:Uncharacterized protein n=1 Tax=Anisodus tanguticus TaxID=243964 RepID=A0AAE1VSS6_9SOLA|nr:hypothetical protein RND71_007093 [Anisodus tanguticus]
MDTTQVMPKTNEKNNSAGVNKGLKQRVVNKLKVFRSKKTGGCYSAFLCLVNQGLVTLSFFGVGVNLVLFLTRVLGQDNATAANNVSKWTGTVYLCSLLGAFISDSYWGRFLTCAIFQLILLLGLVIISLTSWLFLIKPNGCGDGILNCIPPSPIGTALFYLAIYLVALGYGGHQPTIATFGSDQFDEANPKEKISRAAYFGYFYFALNAGSLISNTILVYYEDSGKWTFGFWASTAAALLGLFVFFLGTPGYRYVKSFGNPLPRVAQVFVATFRKWRVPNVDGAELYEMDGLESSIKGTRKILHSNDFKKLDKAAVVTEEDRQRPVANPWRFMVVPLAGKISGNPRGLTELQRMGVGLVIGMLSMVAAGVTEIFRLRRVIPENETSSLSIFWQIPQYILVGASEVFMYVGQLEFFNGQAPDGIKSLGSSLCMASMSLGNYVSSMLVNMVMQITARGTRHGWIPENLNNGHIDRFYFLLFGLALVDLVAFVLFAKWYKGINLEGSTSSGDNDSCKKGGEKESEVLDKV